MLLEVFVFRLLTTHNLESYEKYENPEPPLTPPRRGMLAPVPET